MKYEILTYRAGATIEVVKYIPKQYRGEASGLRKAKPEKKTPEEIREANARQAERKLIRKLNANFHPGDLHTILTYDPKEGRPDPEKAKGIIQRFHQLVRKEYKRRGEEYKYILVTEYKRAAIHHHLVINHINDGTVTSKDIIRRCWRAAGGTGRPKYVDLDETGSYERLAAYLIKETSKTYAEEGGWKQRYSCSRNLINPKPEKRTVTLKKIWSLNPIPKKGYHILQDLTYNGIDKAGYPYQRYYQVKDRPVPEDWDPPGRRKEKQWKEKCQKEQNRRSVPADTADRQEHSRTAGTGARKNSMKRQPDSASAQTHREREKQRSGRRTQ